MNVLVPGVMGELAPQAAELLAERGYEPVLLGEVTGDDIDWGLANVDNDVCVFAVGLIGQYIRYMREHATANVALLAPELCKDCRSLNLPNLLEAVLERCGIDGAEVVWFNHADVAVSCQPTQRERVSKNEAVIGICGNVPVLATRHFHKTIVEHLHKEGCRTVMPPLAHLVHDADFLTPAIEFFDEMGIKTAICILAFGCLGGHAYARGQARKLQREHPNVELTILDYDPSASDINIVNRTELVIQSTREQL